MPQLKWINSRYEILSPLGNGSTSKVYKAIDRKDKNESIVALKILSHISENNEHIQEFFNREVRSLSSLNHPRIIRMLDRGFDEEQGVLYITLEYLEKAASLRERIKNWSPEICDVIDMISDILDGISYAHEAHIIHRDINPSNILIDGYGNIKIIDFGVSKILSTINSGKTVGEFFTRSYASPEQLCYKDIDYSTDLYSLAGVAFFMISHQDPDISILLKDQINLLHLADDFASILIKMASPEVSSRFESAHQALLVLGKAKKCYENETQKVFIQLTNNAIQNLYDQTIINSQKPDEAKAIVHAMLDCDEVFISPAEDVKDEEYDVLGDGISIRCSLGEMKGGSYFSFVARSIQSQIPPHKFEKLRQNGVPIYAKWKIGLTQDPIPKNSTEISSIIDQIDRFIQNKKVEHAKHERRVELVEGWQNILELDRELKSQQVFQIEYSSWKLDNLNQLMQIQLNTEYLIDDGLLPDQLLVMSSKSGRNIPVGHFIRQEGNLLFVSCLRDLDINLIEKKGKIAADERQWAAAWNRQKQALFTLINGRSVNPKLPDILVDPSQAEVQVVDPIEKYFCSDLDDSKKETITQSLGAKDIYLIQGPPGTGKTVVITEIIAQYLSRYPRARILLVSQSNVAVDHVLSKVVKLLPDVLAVRIGKEENLSVDASDYHLDQKLSSWAESVRKKSFEYLKSNDSKSDERKELEFYFDVAKQVQKILEKELTGINKQDTSSTEVWLDALRKKYPRFEIKLNKKSINDLLQYIDKQIDKYKNNVELLLDDWISKLNQPNEFEESYLEVCSIVAGTCVGIAGKKNIPNRFDLAIIDEAGRATPSELLIPLVRAEKFIMVGDYKQLPPVFEYSLQAEAKNRKNIDPIWLSQSLFEYLFNKLDTSLKTTLNTQYRMHPAIARLISEVFYKEEGLISGISAKDRVHGWIKWHDPIVWCSTSNLEKKWETSISNGSFYNLAEVLFIHKELIDLQKECLQQKTIKNVAIISGYLSQVKQLQNHIEPINKKKWSNLRIKINTVDAFQGREEDIVFYSIVRSNRSKEIGFLSDYRRLNVAMSRARELLFIVGDHIMVGQAYSRFGNPFKEVLAYIIQNSQECTLKELLDVDIRA